MKCGNRMCIYWAENTCILDNISLDDQGSCLECISVDIEEETLREYRKRSLQIVENR